MCPPKLHSTGHADETLLLNCLIRRGLVLVNLNNLNVNQKILEDFDTGKSKKAKQRFTTPRMKPFRCKMQIND